MEGRQHSSTEMREIRPSFSPLLEQMTTESPALRNSVASALPTPAHNGTIQAPTLGAKHDEIKGAVSAQDNERFSSPFVPPVMTTL